MLEASCFETALLAARHPQRGIAGILSNWWALNSSHQLEKVLRVVASPSLLCSGPNARHIRREPRAFRSGLPALRRQGSADSRQAHASIPQFDDSGYGSQIRQGDHRKTFVPLCSLDSSVVPYVVQLVI
jgi:hypothetical protein